MALRLLYSYSVKMSGRLFSDTGECSHYDNSSLERDNFNTGGGVQVLRKVSNSWLNNL